MNDEAPPLRIGVLGAARIVRMSLLGPAAQTSGVRVDAIAARSPDRAREYAAKHRIPRVLGSYDELLADPDVDAVYIPTPNALHGFWMRRAIAAGKHVLCEKPFTANADEAAEIAQFAAATDLVVMEAFHSRHHPLWARVQELLVAGRIGEPRSVWGAFCVPLPPGRDIRWQATLGGGALMDVGAYPIGMQRFLFGEPIVTAATAKARGDVDAAMSVQLGFDGGVEGEIVASLWSRRLFAAHLRVVGTEGRMNVRMPYHPQYGGRISIRDRRGMAREGAPRRSSFAYQLERFRDAVTIGAPVLTDPEHGLATMHVVDAAYVAAGMRPRQPLAAS